MGNKKYRDLRALRRDVVALIRSGRFEFSYHAKNTHRDISPEDKRAAVLYGQRDRPNRHARPDQPSYVCWHRHPQLGLLRAVYAIVDRPGAGGQVLVITVFQEEERQGTLG